MAPGAPSNAAGGGGSGMELYRMLESYGLQIHTTEEQLHSAREQRKAVLMVRPHARAAAPD